MGGVLCRPLSRHRCRDQSRKPWRERPRCARWKWPRACPEGSLTPWLSVSVSASEGRAAVSTKAVNLCRRSACSNRGQIVRTIWSRSCGKSWSQSRTRSARDDATDPASAVSRSLHAFGRASEQRAAPRRMRRPSRPRCWICARHRARLVASLRPRMRAAFGP